MIRNTSRKSDLVSVDARGMSSKHKSSISFLALIFCSFFIDLAVPAEAPLSPGVLQLLLLSRDTMTQKFVAAGDATIDDSLPTSNFGADQFLYVGMTSTSTTCSVLRFDLSGVPADKPILSAKMKVYTTSCSVCSGSASLAAYKLTTAWHESTTTWTAPWSKSGGDFDANTVITSPIMNTDVGTWKELDITPWVQAWVADPVSYYGVILRLIDQTSTPYQLQLSSSENAVPAWAPVLMVEYGVP